MPSLIMDSPSLQSQTTHPSRLRSHTTTSFHNQQSSTVDARGAIQKRIASNDRNRSISVSQADRLYRLAAEQSNQAASTTPDDSLQPSSLGVQWITPEHSPQLQVQPFTSEPSLEPFPQWTVPTPPRSDSGVPTVSVDSNDEPVTTGISSGQDFAFEQPTVSAEMSSLGFLLPSQYGASPYDSEPTSYPMDQNYIPPMRMSQPTTTSGSAAYAQTAASSSPALYQQSRASESSASRRHSEMPNSSGPGSSYDQSYRRTSNPYDTSYNSGPYSVAPSQTIPSISGLTQSPLPSPHMSSTSGAQIMPQYNSSSISRSPNLYENNPYGQPYSSAPSQGPQYAPSQQSMYPPPFQVGPGGSESLAKPLGGDSSIRVLNQRPKPQCWEHGCNGRQFSTFSNLLRHQREKSGTAAKSYCPKCGAEFTRTTARNGHLAHDKCTKQRRQSDGK